MEDTWRVHVTVREDGTAVVAASCPRTGEIREVERDSAESALRTLGRTFDNDRKAGA